MSTCRLLVAINAPAPPIELAAVTIEEFTWIAQNNDRTNVPYSRFYPQDRKVMQKVIYMVKSIHKFDRFIFKESFVPPEPNTREHKKGKIPVGCLVILRGKPMLYTVPEGHANPQRNAIVNIAVSGED